MIMGNRKDTVPVPADIPELLKPLKKNQLEIAGSKLFTSDTKSPNSPESLLNPNLRTSFNKYAQQTEIKNEVKTLRKNAAAKEEPYQIPKPKV